MPQAWNEQRCWDQSQPIVVGSKAHQRGSWCPQSPNHTPLVTCPRWPSRTSGSLLLVTWQLLSYLSLQKTPCTVAEVQRTNTDPENSCEHIPGCHTLTYYVSWYFKDKTWLFCEFPNQVISVTACPSRLEMLRAVQWHRGFGAVSKHMILMKITSSAAAEHSKLTARGGGH